MRTLSDSLLESVTCKCCGFSFAPENEPEINMGAVNCPACGRAVDQEGRALREHLSERKESPATFTDYPKSAITAAKEALRWRREHPAEVLGYTSVAMEIAKTISSRSAITRSQVGAMAKVKQSDPKSAAKPWKDAAHVTCMLHGGPEGRKWAKRLLSKLTESDEHNHRGLYWIGPDGVFHRVVDVGNGRGPNHVDYALKHIISTADLNVTDGNELGSRVYSAAFRKRWVRWMGLSNAGLSCGFEMNSKQQAAMRDAGIENGLEYVEFERMSPDITRIGRPIVIYEKLRESLQSGVVKSPTVRGQYWLDPICQWHYCHLGHEDYAIEYLTGHGETITGTTYDAMESRGWVRVVVRSDEILCSGEPTRKQIKEMKDSAIETGRGFEQDFVESDDDEIGTGDEAMTTHGKFWGKEGAGVIFLAKSTGRVLLPFRSSAVNEPHTWGVWGGKLDGDETPEEAARREVREETGHDLCKLSELTVYANGDFKYTTFLAVVDDEFQPRLGWETEKAGWFRIGDWPSPLHFGLRHVLPKLNSINTDTVGMDSLTDSLLERMGIDLERKVIDTTIPSAMKTLYAPPAGLVDSLLEDSQHTANDARIREFMAAHTNNDLDCYLHPFITRGDYGIYLSDVRVAKAAPKGTGTRFMEDLCELADSMGAWIALIPGGIDEKDRKWKRTTSDNRLRTFYRRFGFRRNSDRGRYDMRGTWSRSPERALGEGVMPTKTIYIGSVDDDGSDMVAERVTYDLSDDETPTHAMVGALGRQRWRYPAGCDRVFWWIETTEDAKEAVDVYLAKRGFTNLKHVIMSDAEGQARSDWMQDVSHGRVSVPTGWRYKGQESLEPTADSLLNEAASGWDTLPHSPPYGFIVFPSGDFAVCKTMWEHTQACLDRGYKDLEHAMASGCLRMVLSADATVKRVDGKLTVLSGSDNDVYRTTTTGTSAAKRTASDLCKWYNTRLVNDRLFAEDELWSLSDSLLNEVHYTDVYPKGFQQLVKDWRGRKGEYRLFVQFTNKGDTLDRSVVDVPHHNDPTGNYGYPLKYVIDHPADIWYGHGAKYARILRDNSRNPLILSSMTRGEAEWALHMIGSSWNEAAKLFPDKAKGVTAPGKLFFAMMQLDLPNSEVEHRRRRTVLTKQATKSSAEQNKILRKLGWDAVRDDASTLQQASINDREPQQICFLVPTSFEVLSVYRMSDQERHRQSTRVTDDSERLIRKIAALTAAVMGDKLKDSDRHKFWTKEEREIVVDAEDTSTEWRMRNLKIGQKKHKMFRKNNRHRFDVAVASERGDISFTIYADDKVQDGIDYFAALWKAAEGKGEGKKHTKKSREAEAIKAREEHVAAAMAEEEQQAKEAWPEICAVYAKTASVFGLTPSSLPPSLPEHQYIPGTNYPYRYKSAVVLLENAAAGLGLKTVLNYNRKTSRAVKEAGVALHKLNKKLGKRWPRGWGSFRASIGSLIGNMKAWMEEHEEKQTVAESVRSPLPLGYEVQYDDDFDEGFSDELDKLHADSGINILSCMEFCCTVVKDGHPVAVLYTSSGQDFDFDVIVAKEHQRRGIASHLIDLAIAHGKEHIEATGGKIKADVVNKDLIRILTRKGFVTTGVVGGHTLMKLDKGA